MRGWGRGLAAALVGAWGGVLAAGAGGAAAETLRIATWNLNNLHFETGEALRRRAPVRTNEDYEVLRRYRDRVGADIFAFQEVNGPAAARRVFPESAYDIVISGRYEEDRRTRRGTDRIYTGFAIKRNTVQVVDTTDVVALGLGDRVRRGTEIVVEKDGQALRLLTVHLKSGCFTQSLTNSRSQACDVLADQLTPLEDWIDARAADDTPFVVLGDFNRALDVHGPRDHLWQEIDDGAPQGLKLWRLPFNQASVCWRDTAAYHEDPIDFFVFDDRAWDLVDRGSFRQIDYDAEDRDIAAGTPSDHCPIAVDLRF